MRYLLAILLIGGLMACGGNGKTGNPPDGDMTVYMRNLEMHAQHWRQQIAEGQPPSIPDRIADSMFVAKPTEGKIKDQTKFDGLAENFQFSAMMARSAQPGDEALNFNALVNSCIKCHQAFCPGPIKRIQKLKLPEAQ